MHKKGDLISITRYAIVKSNANNVMVVTDVDTGTDFEIRGKELIDACASADTFSTEEVKTQTEVLERLCQSFNRPFTVEFTKDDGKYRKLRGRMVAPDGLRGRSTVEDLDQKSDHKIRQVNHRTVESFIVDNVKYKVKK